MRNALLGSFMLVGALLLLTSASIGQVPTQDSAVGGAVISTLAGSGEPFSQFQVDAHSNPDGTNPTGTASGQVHSAGGASGHVTCLNVVGNRASIGFNEDFGGLGFHGGLIFVEDNGTPGAGRDRAAFLGQFGGPPSTCPVPTNLDFPAFGIVSGDVTVVDAPIPPPLPTSKEQCKNGGWRNYGSTFKNEGQCVAFAQRLPNH